LFSLPKFLIFSRIYFRNPKSTIRNYIGAVAQLGERLVRNEEAVGSIPISSTLKNVRGIGTLGRAYTGNYFVYILESQVDSSLYTGQTNDLKERLRRHNSGLVKATRSKSPYRLGYFEVYPTRADAMWREWELKKKWNTDRKKKLIENFDKTKLNEISGL
jgi:putative endonuclease